MRQLPNSERDTLVKRRCWLTAGLGLALLTSGCLQDGASTGPSTGAARLALNANVAGSSGSAGAVTALGVRVSYVRSEAEPALLLEQTIPLTGVSPGGTVRQPVAVDLAPCLADPLHQPGGSACSVMVRVALMAGPVQLDVVNLGPVTLRPGETSNPAEVTLHTANNLVVTPATPAPLFPGETLQLTAQLLDAAGGAVDGRAIDWSSNAAAVATVDASGKVTAVVPGNAYISAAGGDRTASVLVRVVARSTIVISRQSMSFQARQSGAPPAAQNAQIVNGVAGTLDGLAIGTISYGTGASGWLSATLSGSSAPATLVLRPTRTDLAPGSYTATVPITAPTAGNSGVAVQVSYNVTAASLLSVGQTLFQVAGRFQQTPGEFRTAVTAAGPLSGLRAEIEYGRYASDWLTARFTSDFTPSQLVLGISGYRLPGNFQAAVRLTSPQAANDVTVQVLWTVPRDGFFFNVYPSQDCVYVQSPGAVDSIYMGATLSDDQAGTMAGQLFSIKVLGPGLRVVSETGTTFRDSAIAVRAPGFLGDVRVVATPGPVDNAPGSLADTVTVRFTANVYDCYLGGYEAGSPSRSPYIPGVPALRRAPLERPSTPAPRQTSMTGTRKATPASAPPSATNRSRPTPEHN